MPSTFLSSPASKNPLRLSFFACAGVALLASAGACTRSEPGRENIGPTIDATVPDASSPPPPAEDAGDGGSQAGGKYGTDCPASAPPSVPPSSPRILILGPGAVGATTVIAAHLQGMLSGDAAFTTPVVTALETDVSNPTGPFANGGSSLMNFFYFPEGRAQRLALLSEPWSYVVLLDWQAIPLLAPEVYFEGVRALGCSARAAGATPIVLMPWSPVRDTPAIGEVTYRVANGTDAIVAPAGYASKEARAVGSPSYPRDDAYIAAASLYTTLTHRSAHDTGYLPAEIPTEQATQFATVAFDSAAAEAGRVHYEGAYRGAVEMRTTPPGGDLWFMASGTSSEQIWLDRMNEIVPKAGRSAHGTLLGPTNPQKRFDEASVGSATPHFAAQQYKILFARGYDVDASAIATAGTQTDLQVQVWDRHFDNDSSDGATAVATMESALTRTRIEASTRGLAWIPNHLAFAKLKTMRPSVALLSDGTHATFPVAYGLATMSIVSRTGAHLSTDGLDPDTQLAAQLADETIRQLSTLSASGSVVADEPSSRPTVP